MPGPGIRSSRSSSFGEGPCAGHGINARWPGQGATVHPRGRPLPSPVRPSLIRSGMAGQGSSRFGAAALGYPSGGHPLLDARRQGGATSTLDADGERGSDGCRHRLRPCGSRLRPAPRRPRRVRPGRAPARPAGGRRAARPRSGGRRRCSTPAGCAATPTTSTSCTCTSASTRQSPDALRELRRRPAERRQAARAHRPRPAQPPPREPELARRPARGPRAGRRRRHHPHARRRRRDPRGAGVAARHRAAPPPRRRRAVAPRASTRPRRLRHRACTSRACAPTWTRSRSSSSPRRRLPGHAGRVPARRRPHRRHDARRSPAPAPASPRGLARWPPTGRSTCTCTTTSPTTSSGTTCRPRRLGASLPLRHPLRLARGVPRPRHGGRGAGLRLLRRAASVRDVCRAGHRPDGLVPTLAGGAAPGYARARRPGAPIRAARHTERAPWPQAHEAIYTRQSWDAGLACTS